MSDVISIVAKEAFSREHGRRALRGRRGCGPLKPLFLVFAHTTDSTFYDVPDSCAPGFS